MIDRLLRCRKACYISKHCPNDLHVASIATSPPLRGGAVFDLGNSRGGRKEVARGVSGSEGCGKDNVGDRYVCAEDIVLSSKNVLFVCAVVRQTR